MRHLLRRLSVVVALAFVVSTLGQAVLSANAAEPCPPPVEHHAHHSHVVHSGHAGHQHEHGTKQNPAAPACSKCCAVCLTAPSLLHAPTSGEAIGFVAGPVVYSHAGRTHAGRTVIIDPGIPKRIA